MKTLGNHLGWFVKGAIWSHDGDAACAVKDLIQSPNFESFKSFKEFEPFKAFKEFAPFHPALSGSFGPINCSMFLASGGA